MTKASKSTTIKLDMYIDEKDQLDVSFLLPTGECVSLHPERGLQDILARVGREGSLTLEVKDFFQRNTIYEVYGAVLEENGHDVATHWERTENGQMYTFASLSKAAAMKLVIGAVPRRTEAAVLVAPASRAHTVSARLTNPDDLPPPGGDPIDIDPKGPGASS